MASYDQPEYADKRPRYFDGQFLREQDFIDEQIYHIDRQRRTARMFLTPGVAAGLGVARGDTAGTLAVEAGTALDQAGRLIVLKDRTVVPVALRNVTGATLQIFWRQEESDRAEGGGSAGNTRWYEKPGFEVVASGGTPQNRDAVMLAGFDVAADGTIALRTGSRAIAGIRSLGTLTVAGTSTFSGNVGIGGNPSTHALTGGTDPSADTMRAQLAIHGSALRTEARLAFTTTLNDSSAAHTAMIKAVVPTENGGDLVFQTRDQAFGALGERLRIRNNGNVGIGTAAPGSKLAIAGASSTVNVEVADFVRLIRPGVSGVKNSNSAGFAVGAHETGIAGRSRLDIKLAGGPVEANRWGEIPDVTVMTLQADGRVGIGTAAPANKLHIADGNVRISQFPANDTTAALTSLELVNRGRNGSQAQWNLYTAAIGGGFGVTPNAFEIWEYPNTAKRLEIRQGGDTMLVPGGGNVGVGTTTPQARLDVAGDLSIHGKHALRGNDTWLRLNQDGAFTSGVHTPGLFGPASLNVGAVNNWLNPGYGNVLIAGNVGIGTTATPGVRLQVSNGGAVINGIAIGTDVPGIDLPYEYECIGVTGSSMNLRLHSPNSIVLHAKTHVTGNLGVGNYSPDNMPSWSGGGVICWDVIYYGTLSKQSTIRAKEHVQPLAGVLDRIGHLNPVQFDYRAADRPQREGIGFIAEELHEVFPECATGDDDFFAWGVNESALHALAIAGIQELARKVKLLEHRLGQARRQLQAERRPPIAILREGVDSSGTGEAYVTVRFSAHHAALDQVETVRTLRLPPDVSREQFIQEERERWLNGLDV